MYKKTRAVKIEKKKRMKDWKEKTENQNEENKSSELGFTRVKRLLLKMIRKQFFFSFLEIFINANRFPWIVIKRELRPGGQIDAFVVDQYTTTMISGI